MTGTQNPRIGTLEVFGSNGVNQLVAGVNSEIR